MAKGFGRSAEERCEVGGEKGGDTAYGGLAGRWASMLVVEVCARSGGMSGGFHVSATKLAGRSARRDFVRTRGVWSIGAQKSGVLYMIEGLEYASAM